MAAEANTPVEAEVGSAEASTEAAIAAATAVAKKGARKAAKPARKARRTAKRAKAAHKARADERIEEMTNENIFAGFGAFPGTAGFEKLFADAAERSEAAVKRSRKAAQDLADMYRGNLDALVEAGRIAATGAQSIGQEVAAKSRDTIEQSANTVRSFAEAKTPTELLQLQSDFARNAFDRFVEDSSNLTEVFVKLAGEAFQPISNRASANVEKLNEIAA